MHEEVDMRITKETKENLIYKTGWVTILPIVAWYVFNYLFNVGALSFYGIISGYSNIKIEVDFFSTLFIGGLFFACLLFIYNLLLEKIRLYKMLVVSSLFFVGIIFLLINWVFGLLMSVFLALSLSFVLRKKVLKELSQYKKNIILIVFFVSLFLFSFGTGYFYSKKYTDYYCLSDNSLNGVGKLVLIARINELTGVFVVSKDVNNNLFNKNKYHVKNLAGQELNRCDFDGDD